MSAPAKSSSTAAKATHAPAAPARGAPAAPAKAPSLKAAGNQQLLNALGVRSPLTVPVGAPGDPLEREADEVAARVARVAPLPAIHAAGRAVQRKCTSCGSPMPAAPRLPGTGEALPSNARAYLEPRFGRDFSEVRVHRYPDAADGSRRIGARAFTLGRDIAFAPGELAPDTAAGRRLLAHELTHVVQQEGGQPRVQAEGQLTDEDMAVIYEWIQKKPISAEPWEPRDPRAVPTPPEGGWDVCPSCHKRPWESREERERLRAEALAEQATRDEAERQRKREEAWPGMHKAQHEAELAEQATTLAEDIEASKTALAQIRLQLFERALAQRTGAGKSPATTQITEEMRNRWVEAEQATIVLESIFAATADELTAEVADRLRGPYRGFYASLHGLFFQHDFQEIRTRKFEERLWREQRACPTRSCHQPAQTRPDFSGLTLQPAQPLGASLGLLPATGFAAWQQKQLTESQELDLLAMLEEPAKGPRSTRLAEAEGRNEAAITRAAWKGVIRDFRWAVSIVDEELRSQLWADEQARASLEQFEYQQALLERQQRFLDDHPDALKVRAIFYPKFDFTEKIDEKGIKTEIAKGIPWQFYMTRTAWSDPRTVPGDYAWELHDITAPVWIKNGQPRTVKRRSQVQGDLPALARERYDPKPIYEMDPPRELYEGLDHKDFFPEGELYWISPITGTKDHITTHADWTFGDWLKAIGLTIAILGSLFFPPLSGAMVAAVLVGTGLSIAGGIHRLQEQKEHGVLTEADVERFYWDLALDIASIATLGLGKIAVAARAAGVLRLATGATRAYMVMKNVNLFLDVVNIGVMTHDFIAQYQAIQKSNMTDEQKKAALAKLAAFAMLSAALIVVPLAVSRAREFRKGAALSLDVDPAGKLVASVDPGAEAASHVATRGTEKARIVDRARFTHPDTGETHSFAVWSDGRITRCSETPCLQIAEAVLTRLDELRQRLPAKSANAGGLQALAERAKALRDEAEALAAGSPRKLAAGTEAILAKAREIEADMAALERKVAKETGWSGRVGQAQAAKSAGGQVAGRVTGAERASGRTQAPLDWPIVRIDPKNPPDVVPDGVVLEFPTGERVWRTTGSDKGIVIESRLGPGSRRKDFEAAYYSRGEMEVPGYVKSDLERAHSQGAGTGFESPYAIPYAPREVNQELQNLGIEEFLRELQANRIPGVEYKIVTNTRMHPQTRRLSLIEYSIVGVYQNQRTTLFTTGIRVEGTLEAPIVSIAGDLTAVHPEAIGVLPISDLAHTILQRRIALFARRAAARGRK